MPEAEPTDDGADERTFTGYGVASAVLGVVAVAAVVLGALIWSGHHDAAAERAYQSKVMSAAANWTTVLINMNVDNVDASLAKLHDGTAGQLNSDFEAAIKPYREVVRTLQARTTGQIESVSFEAVHHDLNVQPGKAPQAPALPPELAERTDSVLVVATSVSENSGNKPTTVRWNLRLGVSDVDGKLMISRLESLR